MQAISDIVISLHLLFLTFCCCCSLSHIRLFAPQWTAAHQASLSFTISQSLLKLMSTKSVKPSNHLILSSPSPPVFNLSQHQGLSNESALPSGGQSIGTSGSVSVLPMNIQDCFPLGFTSLILQFKGLSKDSQHHSSKASILWCSAFFIVQLSHPNMTTGKTIPLTRRTFVGKIMSLFFNMLSRLVIAFLSRSKCLNFMASVTICSDFGAQENKVCHCFHCFPIYLP